MTRWLSWLLVLLATSAWSFAPSRTDFSGPSPGQREVRSAECGTASSVHHADGTGNVTALMDAQQGIVARYLYDPFGNTLGQWGPLAGANRYRFSSKEVHPQSGLYDYGFRSYDPSLQRWLTEDPLGEAGGINLYGFVGNNPVNFVDPDGRWWGSPSFDPVGVGPGVDLGRRSLDRETIHAGLDAIGTVEPIGVADSLNALLYASEGDWENFGYSAIGVIPFLGDTGKGIKYGKRVCQNLPKANPTKTLKKLADDVCSQTEKTTAAETRLTTVLGSGRDVAPYANRPGFNVLNMDNLPASEWPRQNALWLNEAIQRGDNIWLVTDPVKHTQLMQQLGKSSYYLDLELPMLQQYSGINAIPKYITSP